MSAIGNPGVSNRIMDPSHPPRRVPPSDTERNVSLLSREVLEIITQASFGSLEGRVSNVETVYDINIATQGLVAFSSFKIEETLKYLILNIKANNNQNVNDLSKTLDAGIKKFKEIESYIQEALNRHDRNEEITVRIDGKSTTFSYLELEGVFELLKENVERGETLVEKVKAERHFQYYELLEIDNEKLTEFEAKLTSN